MKKVSRVLGKMLDYLLCAAVLYATFMYLYSLHAMERIQPIAPIQNTASAQDALKLDDILFIHAVNTPHRAQAKDKHYNGFEIDLNLLPDGRLIVAHDESEFTNNITLDDILPAVKHPGKKAYWLDLKAELTQKDIDQLKETARRFGVPEKNFIFETSGGETARLLSKNGFTVLLQIFHGFDMDDNDPARRAALNQQLAELLEEYNPAAISASFGKYAYLREYFPNVNKAIYSTNTKRPSLKKKLIADKMKKDPSVRIFMIDEYTSLPF